MVGKRWFVVRVCEVWGRDKVGEPVEPWPLWGLGVMNC